MMKTGQIRATAVGFDEEKLGRGGLGGGGAVALVVVGGREATGGDG